MQLGVISWNLFHGRDRAPEPDLHTWRSRLLRISERGRDYAQVNRDLFDQFTAVLRGADWDIALLQECPPRWAEGLATACEAEPHLVLTARNLPRPLDRVQRLAARANPDLIASWEGGGNLTLIRGRRQRGRTIAERRELLLTRRPETRRMAFTRLAPGLCIANLHASEGRAAAERDVALAARTAVEWAAGEPLIFGGDLNLRPATSAALFGALERGHGLSGTTAARAIDHLLTRGLTPLAATAPWPAGRREVNDPTAGRTERVLPIRLSDHAPIEAPLGFEPGGG